MAARTRQLAFRLPTDLIGRIEDCEKHFASTGLDLSRTDVVRLLLTYALNDAGCDLRMLLSKNDGHARKTDGKINGKGDGKTNHHHGRKPRRSEIEDAGDA